MLHRGLVIGSGQQGGERMRHIHVTFAVRADEQQAVDRLLAQCEVEQTERRAARPLQIVDEHDERAFGGGDRPQQLHGVPLRPYLCGQRIPGIRRHSEQRGELGHDRGREPGVGAERLQDPPAKLRQLVLRLRQQQPAQGAEHLIDPVELEVAPVLVELARHEPAVAARDGRPQLVDERRLADARARR